MSHRLLLFMTLIAASAPASAGTPATPTVTASAPSTAPTDASISIAWSDGPPLPAAVAGHVALRTPGGLVVAGGTSWDADQKRWHADAWLLDADAKVWRRQDQLPAPIAYATPVRTARDVYALIGGAGPAGARADVFAWSPVGVEPSVKLPPLPGARCYAGGGLVGSTIVIVGGAADPQTLDGATTESLRLDLAAPTPQWEPAAALPGGPLILPATASSGGMLYVFGGMARSEAGAFADTSRAMRYDPARNRWLALAPLPSPRRGATAVAIGERLIAIIGGCETRSGKPVMLDDVIVYDTTHNGYAVAPDLPYAALGTTAVIHHGKLVVCGGEDAPRHRSRRTVIGQFHLAPQK